MSVNLILRGIGTLSSVPANRPRLISTLSITVAVILLTILGLAVLVRGGDAFSPGPVTAKQKPGVELNGFRAHADFETQCHWCHQPLRGDLAMQCLACHTQVADQLKNQTGAHGRLIEPMACAVCHAEHKGREYDPIQTALENFDHNLTAFPLTGKHAESACAGCHPGGQYDTVTPQCVACHEEPTSHAGLYGDDCGPVIQPGVGGPLRCADCLLIIRWSHSPSTIIAWIFKAHLWFVPAAIPLERTR